MCAEGRGVRRRGRGEEAVVDEHADGVLAMHGWLAACAVLGRKE